MKNIHRLVAMSCILTVTLGGLAGASAALAQGSDIGVRKVVVRYDDLDVTNEAGARALYSRIVTAAERACGWYEWHIPRARRAWKECVDTAVALACDEFFRSRLAALQPSIIE
jgi:UrcA family protein